MSELFKEKQEHPSFGVIGISRVSSGPPGYTLFDSPFLHQHFIDITISRAYKCRTDLHSDYIGTEAELIRVSLSEVQFANMITSPNMGVGTPCTIGRFNGKGVAPSPSSGTRKTFEKEANQEFVELADTASQLQKLTEMTAPKAADRKRMRDLSAKVHMTLRSNLEFFQEQFHKTMEKAVSAARAEIQAHVAHVVQKAGLEAIKKGDEPLRLDP
jgi:hypothetical protein